MNIKAIFGPLAGLALAAAFAACSHDAPAYRTVEVEAPFEMEPIKEFIFPDRDFVITDYGADSDTSALNTEAIARAIEACAAAGGGRVVVPKGTWMTGAVHLRDNVDLHLSEGAVLRFTDNPEDYLPAVQTSWEGMECFNYSPLVYAFGCENVAITGPGMLSPVMDGWERWYDRSEGQCEAQKALYHMASKDVPVEERQMARPGYDLRPHLIQFNRCRNVLLDGFTIRDSPFWTIHMLLCDGGIVRNLDVRAHGFNNDGIDLEMTRNFLVERCRFDQGDDAVVIKAGRNRDAWRINVPTENIVVRDCDIIFGHVLLGIGSEMSAGVRNVYMHDCVARDSVFRLFYAKTNHRRGGFIENIWMRNVKANRMQRVMEVDTDVLYQWRDMVPTYKDSVTLIRGLHMENVSCERAEAIYDLKGDERLPIRDVTLTNVSVGEVTKFARNAVNAEGIVERNVTYGENIR